MFLVLGVPKALIHSFVILPPGPAITGIPQPHPSWQEGVYPFTGHLDTSLLPAHAGTSLPGIPGRDPLVTALSPRAPGEPRCRAGSRPCGASSRGYGRGTGRITERCPRDARQTSVLSLLFDFAAKATPACILCLFPSCSEGDLKAEGWPPCHQDTAPR